MSVFGEEGCGSEVVGCGGVGNELPHASWCVFEGVDNEFAVWAGRLVVDEGDVNGFAVVRLRLTRESEIYSVPAIPIRAMIGCKSKHIFQISIR